MHEAGSTVAILLLAAGCGTRMGGPNKLLAEFDGVPLVLRSARTALESGIEPVIVVTGYDAERIKACLGDLSVTHVDNPDYRSGMASSLKVGMNAAIALDVDGVLVMLADMPAIRPEHLTTLQTAFRQRGGQAFVRAVSNGKPGNPVILPKASFSAIGQLTGDIGARNIIESAGMEVVDVDLGDAAGLDVDTPEGIIAAGGTIRL